jgi:hypothetical protein
MRRKLILLAVMGIVLAGGTGVSLAAVLVSDLAGSAGAGSFLEKNSGPAEVRSVSPGGRDNEVRSSAYRLAARPDKLPEESASYDHEDEERLQANDEEGNSGAYQGIQDREQDDAETED